MDWFRQSHTEVAHHWQVTPEQGLSEGEVRQRQQRYGANELIEKGVRSPLAILWEQIREPMVLILIAAAAISAFLGEIKSVVAIMIIVILNAILGVVQEFRAEKAMAALKQMAAPLVRVRREGRLMEITSRQLVPGDVVLLEAGNIIPADIRLTTAVNLRVQEASLTGESEPVDKHSDPISAGEQVAVGDRTNMAFMGTEVTYGRGKGIVVATGMQTELGRIAELIQNVSDETTPLQRRMGELGRFLLLISIGIVAVTFALGMLRGEDAGAMFLAAVAIAVAVVPEGLPAVVTISLALGAQRMLKRRALIRKLPAVETLGSVTVIASDKTGTLTENKMQVVALDAAGKRLAMDELDDEHIPSMAFMLAGGMLCNDASLETHEDKRVIVGDPTEGALLFAAERAGMQKAVLENLLPRIGEVPFSSERKRMTTIHALNSQAKSHLIGREISDLVSDGQVIAFTKGAVDGLLQISSGVYMNGAVLPMTAEQRQRITHSHDQLAENGLRVLGVAYRALEQHQISDVREADVEHNLIFLGMVGIIDPPRPEVKQAVAQCLTAGIRPIMITGDHPLTARHIAHDLNITQNNRVVTGVELSAMSDEELDHAVDQVPVFARVAPEHKLRIVSALQKKGHIVAMTGDGVNDAPALRRADIGVAMGITGTAVSKAAADMVIVDDNFATIVSAVEEGRTIYDNVRKFIRYILASNTGEVGVLVGSQVLGIPLPLTTLQILYMNLVTDGIPALALSVEKPEKNIMQRPPYAPQESIFARGLGTHLVYTGLLLMVMVLGLAYWGYSTGHEAWSSMVFMTLTLSQMGHALAVRADRESVFSIGLFSNRPLMVAVVVTVLLQIALLYVPFLQSIFDTQPLSLLELVVCLALSTFIFWAVELRKWFLRRNEQNVSRPVVLSLSES